MRSAADHVGMRRLAALLAAACGLALAPAASADQLLPPRGKVFSGLTGGLSAEGFARQTGRRALVAILRAIRDQSSIGGTGR